MQIFARKFRFLIIRFRTPVPALCCNHSQSMMWYVRAILKAVEFVIKEVIIIHNQLLAKVAQKLVRHDKMYKLILSAWFAIFASFYNKMLQKLSESNVSFVNRCASYFAKRLLRLNNNFLENPLCLVVWTCCSYSKCWKWDFRILLRSNHNSV